MEVTSTPVSIGSYGVLIQNLGPDDLYVGAKGVTVETGVLLEAGDTLSQGFSEQEIYIVADGTTDVRLISRGYNSDKLYTKEESIAESTVLFTFDYYQPGTDYASRSCKMQNPDYLNLTAETFADVSYLSAEGSTPLNESFLRKYYIHPAFEYNAEWQGQEISSFLETFGTGKLTIESGFESRTHSDDKDISNPVTGYTSSASEEAPWHTEFKDLYTVGFPIGAENEGYWSAVTSDLLVTDTWSASELILVNYTNPEWTAAPYRYAISRLFLEVTFTPTKFIRP